jgi:hypothetical protein
MAQGQARTAKSDYLNFIFFKIRSCRDDKQRRSWLRRARLALGKRDYLTPAERHEVIVTWSRRDVSNVYSPALAKVLGHAYPAARRDWHNLDAASLARAGFDGDGNKRAKRPRPDYVQTWQIDHGPASNEAWPQPVQLRLI